MTGWRAHRRKASASIKSAAWIIGGKVIGGTDCKDDEDDWPASFGVAEGGVVEALAAVLFNAAS